MPERPTTSLVPKITHTPVTGYHTGVPAGYIHDIRQVKVDNNMSELCIIVDVLLIIIPLPYDILCREQQKLDRHIL